MRRTKIICTLGPACEDEKMIERMIEAGMDVARFNFSHGDHDVQKERIKKIRKISKKMGRYISCLLDTKGPEIRIGQFETGSVELKTGDVFTLTTREVVGDETIVSISFKDLPRDLKQGAVVLIDDGLIELQATNITETDITCKILNGGTLGDKKGVNVPGFTISLPYVSEKDKADIIFGIENEFDFVAASFTRHEQDILDIKKILEEHNNRSIRVIAKIENAEGVKNINDILRVSDGIMVARGDMGVEIPLEDVPVYQKRLIDKAYTAGKIVITATQMLDSMMHNPRPTRAETTDVATAIYDGTSAIMLSGETAAGKYPVEAVQTMARIALRAEKDIDYRERFEQNDIDCFSDVTNAISHAACTTAYDLGASAIITVTKTGTSVRMTSKYRPSIPIIGCSPDPIVCRQLSMSWGVIPLEVEQKDNTDELFATVVDTAKEAGYLKNGDLVVIMAGVPLGIAGTTNLLKVHIVGNVLVKGVGVNNMCASGNLCVANTEKQARQLFKSGDILVIPKTSNYILDLMKQSAGIITEDDNLDSHAAIVGMALDIPVLVGAVSATQILKSGTHIKLDAERGLVCNENRED
ncbi:MAG: pyruvate kinase [Christensenella sp.]|uniref:pyruvate kinase n=1 Tax=Christensenella sp. TaxID=1935934 RepID=UPI002B1FF69B|nr:pyruvate kinase [Christensenella sp.]MEA5003448.1 pyruvate kinase [Christensenella sp.]